MHSLTHTERALKKCIVLEGGNIVLMNIIVVPGLWDLEVEWRQQPVRKLGPIWYVKPCDVGGRGTRKAAPMGNDV